MSQAKLLQRLWGVDQRWMYVCCWAMDLHRNTYPSGLTEHLKRGKFVK